jgi:hypothetical protein
MKFVAEAPNLHTVAQKDVPVALIRIGLASGILGKKTGVGKQVGNLPPLT